MTDQYWFVFHLIMVSLWNSKVISELRQWLKLFMDTSDTTDVQDMVMIVAMMMMMIIIKITIFICNVLKWNIMLNFLKVLPVTDEVVVSDH